MKTVEKPVQPALKPNIVRFPGNHELLHDFIDKVESGEIKEWVIIGKQALNGSLVFAHDNIASRSEVVGSLVFLTHGILSEE